jgi:hypothetical protein
MLVLADRGFCGFPLWSLAAATGADLLWRANSNMKPRWVEDLADGSWLAEFRPSGNAGRKATPLTIGSSTMRSTTAAATRRDPTVSQ